MGIKHAFVSNIPDAGDATKVRPSNWNSDHLIDGDVNFAGHNIINCANLGTGGGPSSESILIDWVTPFQFGAIADGGSHPLSGTYATLAEAQAAFGGAYFFITSLTQQTDYAAVKAASNEAFGADTVIVEGYLAVGAATTNASPFQVIINDSAPDRVVNELVGHTLFGTYLSAPGFVATSRITSNTARIITTDVALGLNGTGVGGGSTYAIGFGEHGDNTLLNKTLYFPAGDYQLGADSLLIRNLRSGYICGAGKLVSKLTADNGPLKFDGIWYTTIRNLYFQVGSGGTNTAALELDGNIPAHPYDTRGVQSVTLQDVFMEGGGGDYAMTMCRQGGSGAQGSECMYINCHFQHTTQACYYQTGFNALANTFMGGNFQDYTKTGINVTLGTAAIINTGFQSTHGYDQIDNGGYDIHFVGGAYEGVLVYGCRTESVRFFLNEGGVTSDVRACHGSIALGGWLAGVHFGSGTSRGKAIHVNTSDGFGRIFITASVDAVSGGVEPTWPTDRVSSVVDGGLTWTESVFYFAEGGRIDYATVSGDAGLIVGFDATGLNYQQISITNTEIYQTTGFCGVDSSGGALNVIMPYVRDGSIGANLVIKKLTNDTNTITIKENQQPFKSPVDGSDAVQAIIKDAFGWKRFIIGKDLRWIEAGTSSVGAHAAITTETLTGYITVYDNAGTARKVAVVS